MDALKIKKSKMDIAKEIAQYILIAAMWLGMLVMGVVLS